MLNHWIVIYPVDSAVQLLNNWGQGGERQCGVKVLALRNNTMEGTWPKTTDLQI